MKNFNKNTAFVVLATIFALVSCEKEEMKEETTSSEINWDNVVAKGDIIQVPDKDKGDLEGALSRTEYSAWSKITRDDLSKMGNNLDLTFAKNRFDYAITSINGVLPINVCVNDVKIGTAGINPCIQPGINWVAQKRFVGTGTNNAALAFNTWRPVSTVSTITDRNYLPNTQQIGGDQGWLNSKTKTSDWSVSATAGITVGGKIGVPFVTEGSVEVTLSATAGTGGSNTDTWETGFKKPLINVPVGKAVRYTLMERWQPKSDTWSVPLNFQGYVGADYGKKVNDHYWWAVGATSYFYDYQNGSKKYTITVNERSNHGYQVIAEIVN